MKKIFRIFQTKSRLIDEFRTKIKQSLTHELYNENQFKIIINTEYLRITEELANNISVRNVIKEFLKSPLNIEIDNDKTKQLLKKFNLVFNEEEINALIEELKEEIDLEYEKSDRFSQIKQLLKRYHETKDDSNGLFTFLTLIEDKIFDEGDQQEIEQYLDQKKHNVLDAISYCTERIDKRDFDELDEMDLLMSEKEVEQMELNILNDFTNIFKLLNKKGLETNYREIRNIFIKIEKEYKENLHNEVVEREFKRISSYLGNKVTIHTVLKEYIKPPNYDSIGKNIDYIKSLLRKFDLKWDENNLNDLIQKIREEVYEEVEKDNEDRELEEFEKYFDSSKVGKHLTLPDYSSLNGIEFESFLKKIFEIQGYIVTQTKSTGDQGADLILLKENEKTTVQVKKYTGKVSNKAIQEVVASKKYYDCKKAIVVTNSEFTSSAIRLAISNEVVLWDSNKLKQVVYEINNN